MARTNISIESQSKRSDKLCPLEEIEKKYKASNTYGKPVVCKSQKKKRKHIKDADLYDKISIGLKKTIFLRQKMTARCMTDEPEVEVMVSPLCLCVAKGMFVLGAVLDTA